MASVMVLTGKNRGEWYTVSETNPLTFGRDAGLLAEIIDPGVSHRHAEVHFSPEAKEFRCMDLNSRNGTVVNRKKCRPWLPVHDGDVIKLGHTLIVFTTREFDSYEQGESMYKQLRELHAERVERNEESQADYGIRVKGKSKESLGGIKDKLKWFKRR